ncbi:hypothetical protein [Nocardia cyriacigeorgica]|uniref:hypothetical protein n=1 Tax=Nocardia cyriacigeorgica TaxID=135487 RepID=UPI0009D9B6B5|nr:hypothetical protein [Nocardia cyriacigeorgica]MBF6319335.1 hypothetical protein [Nocardia cyriacigeorgica]MBF6413575.1 hypothetical protein [Nocardia cyriacigeorgica]MBF6535295.1 hypothetical protein [Nocardia cyriacigeorgica]TLF58437.1 hypothetical protein FEK31_10540 [Nocardia cyriacigeorgica]
METPLPPIDHGVPLGGLTVDAAHDVMQRHIDCPITVCPIKRRAKAVLIESGRFVPSEHPKFGY